MIRDTGSQRRSGTSVGAEQSWTVSQKATSIHAVSTGHGLRLVSRGHRARRARARRAQALPMREGGERWGELYLVFADRDYAGRGALRLAELIREHVAEQCQQQPGLAAPAHADPG